MEGRVCSAVMQPASDSARLAVIGGAGADHWSDPLQIDGVTNEGDDPIEKKQGT